MRSLLTLLISVAIIGTPAAQTRYRAADGTLRISLARQPLGPNGPSKGPETMAAGGIQTILADLGATVRVERAELTNEENVEYGGWKKLGMSLGHFADIVKQNERNGHGSALRPFRPPTKAASRSRPSIA